MAEKHRCEALEMFLRQLQKRLGIRTQGDMAKELGMSESTYKARLRDPRHLDVGDLWIIDKVAHRVGLDLKEVSFL